MMAGGQMAFSAVAALGLFGKMAWFGSAEVAGFTFICEKSFLPDPSIDVDRETRQFLRAQKDTGMTDAEALRNEARVRFFFQQVRTGSRRRASVSVAHGASFSLVETFIPLHAEKESILRFRECFDGSNTAVDRGAGSHKRIYSGDRRELLSSPGDQIALAGLWSSGSEKEAPTNTTSRTASTIVVTTSGATYELSVRWFNRARMQPARIEASTRLRTGRRLLVAKYCMDWGKSDARVARRVTIDRFAGARRVSRESYDLQSEKRVKKVPAESIFVLGETILDGRVSTLKPTNYSWTGRLPELSEVISRPSSANWIGSETSIRLQFVGIGSGLIAVAMYLRSRSGRDIRAHQQSPATLGGPNID